MTHATAVNRQGRRTHVTSWLTAEKLIAHLTRLGWVDVEIVTPERQAS